MKSQIIKSFLIVLSTLLFSPVSSLYAVDKDATFTVQKGDIVFVNIEHGNITVNSSDKSDVKVHAKNIDEEDVNLLTMEKKSGKVEIKFEGNDSDDFQLEITIPADLILDFSTGGGNITVNDDVKNKIKFSTGGGNILAKNVYGSFDVSSGGGNITAGDINGETEISTAGGDIKVGSVNGKAEISSAGGNINVGSVNNTAEISTGGGNISVGTVNGNADISTGGGNIKVSTVSGSADISTGGGNVILDGATGKVEVNTGGGNIELKNIKGSIEASTGAGNITAELIPDSKSSSDLNSGVGDITLYIPESSKATIVATASDFNWGNSRKDSDNIKSDFESYNISQLRRGNTFEAIYELNGGGSKIELNVGMGEIRIKKSR